MSLPEITFSLVLGSYAWSWLLYDRLSKRLSKGIRDIWEHLHNEQAHELQCLRDRIKELEDRP